MFEEGEVIIWGKWYFWVITLLFPMVNLLFWGVNEANIVKVNWTVNKFLVLCLAAVAEELFFRGLLQNELLSLWRRKKLAVIFGINIFFGVLHLLNIFSNSNIVYSLVQAFCAFCVGIALSAIYYRMHKLVIGIMIHAFINITSLVGRYGTESKLLNDFETMAYILVALIYFVIGLLMLKEDCMKEDNDEFIY